MDIKIKWNNKDEIVKIKKMTMYEKDLYQSSIVDVKVIGRQTIIKPIMENRRIMALYHGIETAPFKYNDLNDLKKLPEEIGSLLFDKINKLNSLEEGKKSNSEEQ